MILDDIQLHMEGTIWLNVRLLYVRDDNGGKFI